MKRKLQRIVSMLTRMAMKADGVAEMLAGYGVEIDYEHEHRCAEHEHETETEPERCSSAAAQVVTTAAKVIPVAPHRVAAMSLPPNRKLLGTCRPRAHDIRAAGTCNLVAADQGRRGGGEEEPQNRRGLPWRHSANCQELVKLMLVAGAS
jgi:hypothetical protein